MDKQSKGVPAAKAVTLLAFFTMIAIVVLFAVGMFETSASLGKEVFGISEIIDEIKLIFEDVSGYFKELFETIKMLAKGIEKGSGIALLCQITLQMIFPLVAILCAVVVALHIVFCWTPFTAGDRNKTCIRMGKKLRKVVGWIVGFLVYAFAVFGGSLQITLVGKIVLYVIAGYAIVRVLLDGIGKGASVVNVIFTTISAAAISVFALIVFNHLLFGETPLWNTIFNFVESAVLAMQGEEKNTEVMLMCIYFALCYLAVFIALQRTAKIMNKQITMDRGGVRKSLIWLLVWTLALATLHFLACRQQLDGLSLDEWKDMEGIEFFTKAVLYGLIGLGLAIVTPILNCIGKRKESDE